MSSEKPQRRDMLYREASGPVSPFKFDASVVAVFEDMIRRSVPGYGLTLQLITTIAAKIPEVQRVYDLGCSLGAGMVAADRGLSSGNVEICGIDNSPAMLEQARKNLRACDMRCRFSLLEADIAVAPIETHQLCLLNFTLQFVELDLRVELLKRIFTSLTPGGHLVLSEKIHFADPEVQELQTAWHHAFKKQNGYSDLEISRKRSALENRLIPERLEAHVDRLKAVGFSTVIPWFQAFSFVSLVAVK